MPGGREFPINGISSGCFSTQIVFLDICWASEVINARGELERPFRALSRLSLIQISNEHFVHIKRYTRCDVGAENTQTFPARTQVGGGKHQGRAQRPDAGENSSLRLHASPLSISNPQRSFPPPDLCICSALCLKCHFPTSLPGELQFLRNSNVTSSEGFPVPPGKMQLPVPLGLR